MAAPSPRRCRTVDADRLLSAQAIVRVVAIRRLKLFSAFPDLSLDDLMSEGLLAVHRACHRFDAKKSLFSTWAYRVATCRLIDLYRVRCRESNRIAKHIAFLPPEGMSEADMQQDESDEPDAEPEYVPLDEWLRTVYIAARDKYGSARYSQGRRYFNVAQVVAIAALVKKQSLTCRGCADLLRCNHELRLAIRLTDHLPSKDFVARAVLFWKREVETRKFAKCRITSGDSEQGR